jgi:hypothetical protein
VQVKYKNEKERNPEREERKERKKKRGYSNTRSPIDLKKKES